MTRHQSKGHVTVEAVVLYQDHRGSVFEPLESTCLAGQQHVHVVVTEPGGVRAITRTPMRRRC